MADRPRHRMPFINLAAMFGAVLFNPTTKDWEPRERPMKRGHRGDKKIRIESKARRLMSRASRKYNLAQPRDAWRKRKLRRLRNVE